MEKVLTPMPKLSHTDTPRVTGEYGDDWQALRLSLLGGGPGGMEVVIECTSVGVRVRVWNPYRDEWVEQTIRALG